MFSSPFSLIPPLFFPIHVHSHAFQLGSEAMVEIPPSVSSLRGFKAADSVVEASEGPWLSQVGHRRLVHDNMMGSQEIGRSNDLPPQDSNPGREKSRPSLHRYWKLNALGLTVLTLSMRSPICLMLPRLGGQESGGGDFAYRIPP